jgi:hypothetical protein
MRPGAGESDGGSYTFTAGKTAGGLIKIQREFKEAYGMKLPAHSG